MNKTSQVFHTQEKGKTYIFDTGAPFSLYYDTNPRNKSIEKLYPNLMNDIQKLLNKPVDGLIGMDVIQQDRWHFEKCLSTLHRRHEFHLEHVYPLNLIQGIPVVEVEVLNHVFKFWLDTGSSVNYIKAKYLTQDLNERIEDYSPLIGWFSSLGTTLSLSAFGKQRDCSLYVAPTPIESMMGESIDGILGFEFMSTFSWVLDIPAHTIEIESERESHVLPVPFFPHV